jgi:hypothetical protein
MVTGSVTIKPCPSGLTIYMEAAELIDQGKVRVAGIGLNSCR